MIIALRNHLTPQISTDTNSKSNGNNGNKSNGNKSNGYAGQHRVAGRESNGNLGQDLMAGHPGGAEAVDSSRLLGEFVAGLGQVSGTSLSQWQ